MTEQMSSAELNQQPALPGLPPTAGTDDVGLAKLAQQLRSTAADGLMDPQYRVELRRQVLDTHPARTRDLTKGSIPAYWRVPVPGGTLFVATVEGLITCTDLTEDEPLFIRECMARFGMMPQRAEPPAGLARAIQGFVAHGRFRGKLNLTGVPAFQQRVLLKAMEIPRGEVRPYQWLAREAGQPQAARAVGTAMAHNPIPILIPCHRVVRSDYRIGEYGCGGPAKKKELLQLEGVDVGLLERMAAGGRRFLASRTTRIFCLPVCSAARRIQEENRVFLADDAQARAAGFRPCRKCRPA